MELTDTPGGFIFPAKGIQPTANYILPGLIELAEIVRKT